MAASALSLYAMQTSSMHALAMAARASIVMALHLVSIAMKCVYAALLHSVVRLGLGVPGGEIAD